MSSSAILPAHAGAVIFDAYGTLFDVHSAVARHMAAIGPDAARFSETWRAKQLEYSWVLSLAGCYEPFWTLTEKALDYAFDRFPDVDRSVRPLLLEAYRTLDAYPEVWAAAGTPSAVFAISPATLAMLSDALVAPCAEDQPEPAAR